MKKLTFTFIIGLFCFAATPGCGPSGPNEIEQTMSQEEIEAMDEEYEAEMEAAESDTLGEG